MVHFLLDYYYYVFTKWKVKVGFCRTVGLFVCCVKLNWNWKLSLYLWGFLFRKWSERGMFFSCVITIPQLPAKFTPSLSFQNLNAKAANMDSVWSIIFIFSFVLIRWSIQLLLYLLVFTSIGLLHLFYVGYETLIIYSTCPNPAFDLAVKQFKIDNENHSWIDNGVNDFNS